MTMSPHTTVVLSLHEWQSQVNQRFPNASFVYEDGSGKTYGSEGEWTAATGPDMQADVVGVYTSEFCSVLADQTGEEDHYYSVPNPLAQSAA